MPNHTCDHDTDHPHEADRLEEIETLADELEEALYDTINSYAETHPGTTFSVVYQAVISLAQAYERRIIGYAVRPTCEDLVLNAHLEMVEALYGDERETFALESKALFDVLHTAIVHFLEDQPQACLCVVHQGTRGLVHTVSLNRVDTQSDEA
jgi:hypothetical protein